MRLDEAVTEVQRRLSDRTDIVWSRDEIALYLEDGYDELCDRARVLFDMHCIENVPPIGSYTTDLAKYLASQRPGRRFHDNRLDASQTPEYQKGLGDPPSYAGSYDLPVRSGEGEAE